MSDFLPSKWQVVHYYIKKAIEKVNHVNATSGIREKFGMENEERSCIMIITGLGKLYLTTDGSKDKALRIRELDSIQKPTSTITIDEDTFIRIKRGDITFDESYWFGQVDVQGDFWLRDLVIFSEVFKQFGSMVVEH